MLVVLANAFLVLVSFVANSDYFSLFLSALLARKVSPPLAHQTENLMVFGHLRKMQSIVH
jgi:hypothetical protein